MEHLVFSSQMPGYLIENAGHFISKLEAFWEVIPGSFIQNYTVISITSIKLRYA